MTAFDKTALSKEPIVLGEGEQISNVKYIELVESQWTTSLWFKGVKQNEKYKNICVNESDLLAASMNSQLTIYN